MTQDPNAKSSPALGSLCLVDFVERYGIHPEKLRPWQRELIDEQLAAITSGGRAFFLLGSRTWQKRTRAVLEADWRAVFDVPATTKESSNGDS